MTNKFEAAKKNLEVFDCYLAAYRNGYFNKDFMVDALSRTLNNVMLLLELKGEDKMPLRTKRSVPFEELPPTGYTSDGKRADSLHYLIERRMVSVPVGCKLVSVEYTIEFDDDYVQKRLDNWPVSDTSGN